MRPDSEGGKILQGRCYTPSPHFPMPYASLNSNYQRSICIGKRNDEQKSRQPGSSGGRTGRQANLKEKKKERKIRHSLRGIAGGDQKKSFPRLLLCCFWPRRRYYSPEFPLLQKTCKREQSKDFAIPFEILKRVAGIPQPGSPLTPIANFTIGREKRSPGLSPHCKKRKSRSYLVSSLGSQVLPGWLSLCFYAGSRP